MKKINIRAVMMILSPILGAIYTITAVWRHLNDYSPAKIGVAVVIALLWFVCGILWTTTYYTDKKIKQIDAELKKLYAQRAYSMKYLEYFTESIQKTFRNRREELGMSAGEVAEAAKCTEKDVLALEQGGSVFSDRVCRILEVLGLDEKKITEKAQRYADDRMKE